MARAHPLKNRIPFLSKSFAVGLVESVHRGRVAIVSSDGRLTASLGSVSAPIYPRSANKPLQAVGMIRTGLDLTGELLALVCASHSGEAFHQAGVRRILYEAGEVESVLQTPPDWPLDERERETAMRNGAAKSSVAMNCSGNHAGMIMTTVRNNGDVMTYLDPKHPTQLAILRGINDLADEKATGLAVDGCGGAPLRDIAVCASPSLWPAGGSHGRCRGAGGRS